MFCRSTIHSEKILEKIEFSLTFTFYKLYLCVFDCVFDLWWIRDMSKIKLGEFFENCAFHPMVCVSVDEEADDIVGISLIDGEIRGCSLSMCGVRKLTLEEVVRIRCLGPDANRQIFKHCQHPNSWDDKWWNQDTQEWFDGLLNQ